MADLNEDEAAAAVIAESIENGTPVILTDDTVRRGCCGTMHHGNGAVCELPPGHEGDHLSPAYDEDDEDIRWSGDHAHTFDEDGDCIVCGADLFAASVGGAEIIDVITDALGDEVSVGWSGRAVIIGVTRSPAIFDTPEMRDRFAKAYAEAERRAEASAATEGPRWLTD